MLLKKKNNQIDIWGYLLEQSKKSHAWVLQHHVVGITPDARTNRHGRVVVDGGNRLSSLRHRRNIHTIYSMREAQRQDEVIIGMLRC